MEHAVGSAPATTVGGGRKRPGWWWTIGSLLLAWLLAIAVLMLIGLPLMLLDVAPEVIAFHAWPWRSDSAWAVAAGIGLSLPFCAALTLATRLTVERRSEWKLRAAPLLLACVGLSWLLRDPVSDEAQSAGFWAAAALVVVVRQVAIVPQRSSARPPLPLLVGGGLVAVALLAAGLAYRPLHPLDIQLGSERSSVDGADWDFGSGDGRRAVAFAVVNESRRDVRIVGVRAHATGAPVTVEFDNPAEEYPIEALHVPLPAGGLALSSGRTTSVGAEAVGRVRLPAGSCRDGGVHRAEVRGLAVELETLGFTRTQRLQLDSPVVLRCPR